MKHCYFPLEVSAWQLIDWKYDNMKTLKDMSGSDVFDKNIQIFSASDTISCTRVHCVVH